MKILKLEAENIKRLQVVSITPEGNLVEITGDNGQGKTSVLDSIWWALAGAANIQDQPIRKGEKKATIKLDLGVYTVERTFKSGKTSSIKVTDGEGNRIEKTPQALLEGLLSSLTFDPLAFSRLSKKQQFDALKPFCPDIEFDKIAEEHEADFQERAKINREAQAQKVMADKVKHEKGDPIKRVDTKALLDQIEEAGTFNADIQKRQANRDAVPERTRGMRTKATEKLAEAEQLRARAQELAEEAERLDNDAKGLEEKLAAAPPLEAERDVSEIRKQLGNAEETNARVANYEQKENHLAEYEKLKGEAQVITARMEARQKEKREAIAKAKLPVDGISFGEDEILLEELPWDQASDAQQLTASVQMAMAMNPKLRVLRVRDGSLLDKNALASLGKMADANDFQIWIERVGAGETGFILEDGMSRKAGGKKPTPGSVTHVKDAAKPPEGDNVIPEKTPTPAEEDEL